jgi:hypothetical protein
MDSRDGAVCHSVRRAFSWVSQLTQERNINLHRTFIHKRSDIPPETAILAAGRRDTSRAEVQAASGKASHSDPCDLMCSRNLCCHGAGVACRQATIRDNGDT